MAECSQIKRLGFRALWLVWKNAVRAREKLPRVGQAPISMTTATARSQARVLLLMGRRHDTPPV